MARPRIELNLEQLKSLVRIHATAEECASVLGMCADTLDTRLKELGFAGFSEFYKKYLHEGKISLRRLQWKKAQEGNTPMLIWLGKQMLGQKDQVEHAGEIATEPQKIEIEIIEPVKHPESLEDMDAAEG